MSIYSSILNLPRRALEIVSRGKVVWKRLPGEFAAHPILVTPDSVLSFLKPGKAAFDPMLLRFATEFVSAGKVVWDLGANVGVFSLAAAVLGGEVLAVEADPWLHQLLQRTVMHPKNRDLRITPLCAAVGDKVGVARLHVAQRGRSANYIEGALGSTQTGGVRYATAVPMLTLDVVAQDFAAPDVLKIDVEGAEKMVFEGAEDLFRVKKPVILVEVNRENRKFVFDFLQDRQYRLLPYDCQHIEDAFNILAVPASHG